MAIGTSFNQEEPRGFGISPFGDPTTVDKEFRTSGFGDPITKMSADESSKGTTYTGYTND